MVGCRPVMTQLQAAPDSGLGDNTAGPPHKGCLLRCLSRMTGNCHVRFLGGKGAERPLTYPIEVDPLLCSNCQGSMRIIAFIDNNGLIRKILKHIGLWETRSHSPPPPKTSGELYIPEITYDYSYSQIPSTDYWT